MFSHVAVYLFEDVYDNTWLVTAQNGVPCGKALVPTGGCVPCSTASAGEGPLFVGGSDHSQQNFYLHSMRAFESSAPLITDFSSFIPPRSLASPADFLVRTATPLAR